MKPYYDDGWASLYVGDALETLREIPDGAAQMCVTSPPYWGLRDYGVEGQLGLEPTPEQYVERMVDVFREVRRVLRDDGTLWVNIGDSYATSNPVGRRDAERPFGRDDEQDGSFTLNVRRDTGCKPKDLVGIPWMLAFALRAPYERHVITDVAWRGWMAGLVDGEGCYSCVTIPPGTGVNESHSTRLQIRMADTEAVERVVHLTGMNSVTYDQLAPSMVGKQRPAQQWKVSGEKMADLTADIYPFLTVKRRQAVIAWNLQKLKVPTKRGQPIPEENMAKRRVLYDLLHDMNQRRSADIPSWCSEPMVESEPGWYLRSDCIWAKPNPMPESVTDRPTKAHEYLFLLSKRDRYWYDADAIREASEWARWGDQTTPQEQMGTAKWIAPKSKAELQERRTDKQRGHSRRHAGFNDRWDGMSKEEQGAMGRNKRTVWSIATEPYPEAHFATFPTALVTPCVLAGCPEGGTVLEPFAGSGTTLQVAKELGRKSIGIELNADYAKLATQRLMRVPQPFPVEEPA